MLGPAALLVLLTVFIHERELERCVSHFTAKLYIDVDVAGLLNTSAVHVNTVRFVKLFNSDT